MVQKFIFQTCTIEKVRNAKLINVSLLRTAKVYFISLQSFGCRLEETLKRQLRAVIIRSRGFATFSAIEKAIAGRKKSLAAPPRAVCCAGLGHSLSYTAEKFKGSPHPYLIHDSFAWIQLRSTAPCPRFVQPEFGTASLQRQNRHSLQQQREKNEQFTASKQINTTKNVQ